MHRLGNLVLTSENQKLSNFWIDKKLNNAPNYCYNDASATNSEKEIKKFTDGTHWNIADMMARELKAMEFFIDRWRLDCWDEDQKITINPEYCNTIKGSKRGTSYPPVSKRSSIKIKLPSFCLRSINLFAEDEED